MERKTVERKTASDFEPELLKLFDRYVHGAIDRRQFLDSAGRFAIGGLTAVAILEMLAPNYAFAEQVPKDDGRIKAERITYASPQGYGTVNAYLVRPAAAGRRKIPGVVVIHENRGLNPYVEDVARRMAVAGFMAFAPDALTTLGGWPGNDEKGVEMQRTLDGKKLVEDFVAAANTLKARPDCTGKIGAVGFCYGGGIANTLAVRVPEVKAVAPFYGAQPVKEDVAKMKAAVQAHYAGLDERVNAGWPAFEAALKEYHIPYEGFVYANVNHGFHNDTTPRYDKAAATLAESRTIAFFNKYLK